MNPADEPALLQRLIDAGRDYANLLESIQRSNMTRAGRDDIDAINKRINAAVDNVFGFDIAE